MHGEQQHVLRPRPAAGGGRAAAGRRAGRRAARLLGGEPPGLALRAAARRCREVDDAAGARRPARARRTCTGSALAREGGAQGLVAAHDLVQAAPQGGTSSAPGRREGAGDVVGGAAGVELVEEPQPLLGEGERQRRLAGALADAADRPFGACSRPAVEGPGERQGRGLEERRSGSSTPKASRTRETSWVASSEWPPRSKKPSSMPSTGCFSTVPQRPTRISSRASRGTAPSGEDPCRSGSGSALRSTLPLGRTGNASRNKNLPGTNAWGNCPAK